MPTFSQLHLTGNPPIAAPPPSNGTGLEHHNLWAVEVSLDVEWAHSIAPGANIILVTTPTAETLGVQGFTQMMLAEDYVVKHHLAGVISQSFASGERAFGSTQSLLNLRFAFKDAQAAGVTVLGSSGDDGTAEFLKSPPASRTSCPRVALRSPAASVGFLTSPTRRAAGPACWST